jgi:rhamnulokinase
VSTVVAAVDFGATSVRVARVDLDAAPVSLDVVHRHRHEPVPDGRGGLRWDWDRLVAEAERGLERALAAGPLASIGVDTWGVDYGLIDGGGRLLGAPHCYRSARTAGFRAVVDRIGERRLYELCGLQLQPFTTLFQLAAHGEQAPEELAAAEHLLLLPDLVVQQLTGDVGAERTAAGTSGLVDLATGDWSPELLDACGVPARLLPELRDPGSAAGAWRGIPVHRVGGHDTASAVAALPPTTAGARAFVASGTWLLVGREQPAPDTSPARQAANFTNEVGVDGSIRLLKNVAGFWLLEECRRSWGGPDVAALLDAAAGVRGGYTSFDAADGRFLAPADMEAEVRDAAGIDRDAGREVVARAIVASLAATAAAVVVDGLPGTDELALLGGGAEVALLRDELAARSGLPVRVGATEAAAVGNALVQGIALGRFTDLAEARRATVAP